MLTLMIGQSGLLLNSCFLIARMWEPDDATGTKWKDLPPIITGLSHSSLAMPDRTGADALMI